VTVLPWNFFQSKSAALAAVVTTPNAAPAVIATRIATAFPDMCSSLASWFSQIAYVNGYSLRHDKKLDQDHHSECNVTAMRARCGRDGIREVVVEQGIRRRGARRRLDEAVHGRLHSARLRTRAVVAAHAHTRRHHPDYRQHDVPELAQARNLISRGVDGLVLRGDCHHDALRRLLACRQVFTPPSSETPATSAPRSPICSAISVRA
jgi:hypothetical protein